LALVVAGEQADRTVAVPAFERVRLELGLAVRIDELQHRRCAVGERDAGRIAGGSCLVRLTRGQTPGRGAFGQERRNGGAPVFKRQPRPRHRAQDSRGTLDSVRTAVEILRDAETIAIVGASPDPSRPSYGVMAYLQRAGYRVFPVNPQAGGEVLGVRCVAELAELEEPIDVVDVFRRPEFCAGVAAEAAAIGAGSLWLQLGVRSSEARRIAESAGMSF